ncbi:MAG TPA: hypothetical protein DEA96_15570 [Leptospiraceae bacterium]|nr:hypothetical protein [Spirochaetaceae bacterium]HBS06387.1 hypothetical protein [Leptospiraceae bacterium]
MDINIPRKLNRVLSSAAVALALLAIGFPFAKPSLASEPGATDILLRDAEYCNLRGVELALQHGADPNARSRDGKTAAMYILECKARFMQWQWAGDVRLEATILSSLARLLEAGADLAQKDSQNRSLLEYAFTARHLPAVQLLLEAGAEFGAGDCSGKGAVKAFLTNYVHAFEYIRFPVQEEQKLYQRVVLQIIKRCESNQRQELLSQLLEGALRTAHFEAIPFLMELEAGPPSRWQDDGPLLTLLQYSEDAAYVALESLLSSDFAHEIAKWKTVPALHQAALLGNTQALKLMIESGIPADIRAESHETALHVAALFGHTGSMQYLVSQGLSIESKARAGRTPLMFAVQSGELEAVAYLLQKGASIHAKDQDGITALHLAVKFADKFPFRRTMMGSRERSEFSLHRVWSLEGRKIDLVDLQRIQPDGSLTEAIDPQKDYREDSRRLEELRPAQPSKEEIVGTPPQKEEVNGPEVRTKILELLLDSGARPNARDSAGRVPLDFASEAARPVIAPILSKYN